jgi:hypothetical protein
VAIARPMPLLDPVTRAVRPVRSNKPGRVRTLCTAALLTGVRGRAGRIRRRPAATSRCCGTTP